MGVKPLVLNDEDRGMFMEPMQGKLSSSQFDLGHTDLFSVPEVTSVSSRLVTVLLGTF